MKACTGVIFAFREGAKLSMQRSKKSLTPKDYAEV